MEMNTILLTVLLLTFASSMAEMDNERLAENFLMNLESISYDKRTPPEGSNGPGSAVDVAISAYIIDIEKINDDSMGFKAHFYFRQSWIDSRLKYSDDYGSVLLRDEQLIWNPDLFFVDEREGSIHQIMQPNKFIKIKPNGKVLYSAKLAVEFSCPMDLRNYPHDIQKCVIDIESYGHQKNQLNLEWYEGTFDAVSAAHHEMSPLEFNLIEIEKTSSTESVSTGEYKRLQIHLTFKRKFGFYANRLYVPFIILVIMSSLSLWIKAEEKCLRLCLILVVLYLMLKLSSDINDLIPASPCTKAIDVWIAFCDSLVFAIFLEFIVVAGIVGWKKNTSYGEELLPTLDPMSKDVDTNTGSLKSPPNKLIRMFNAGNREGGNRNDLSYRIDRISRIVFPVIFILFNIIYWSVYISA